jgi:hypothetical protein
VLAIPCSLIELVFVLISLFFGIISFFVVLNLSSLLSLFDTMFRVDFVVSVVCFSIVFIFVVLVSTAVIVERLNNNTIKNIEDINILFFILNHFSSISFKE